MATPNTGTALLIVASFVLPGFVAILIKERIYDVRGEEAGFDRLLTTAYYSVLIWSVPALIAILAGVQRQELEHFFNGRSPLWLTGLVAICVLLILPAIAAYAAWRWVDSDRRVALL